MDPSNLLQLLSKNQIDFVIIGGFAGTIHGSSLVTKDLDICMAVSPANIQKIRQVLNNLHPNHRMTPQKLSFLTHPENLENIKNMYLGTDIGILDILSSVIGVGDFDRVKSQSTQISLFGHLCNVISIEDLIQSKKAMGRDKDKIAIKELEIIRSKTKK